MAGDNLGILFGLISAAALLIDYTLNVAVSIATGIQSLTSAVPTLAPARVGLALGALALITMANLRGVRAAGVLFSAPVHLYIIGTLGVLGFGVVQWLGGTLPPYTPPEPVQMDAASTSTLEAVGVLLILRAFASGAVALTGVEAISNGVPYFRAPEATHARRTLLILAGVFAALFLAISTLSAQLGIVADPQEVETVLSQLTRTLIGRGPLYVLLQGLTVLMLILAANTGFADFPRLLALLGEHQHVPSAFSSKGSRLALSNGTLLVAIVAAAAGGVSRGRAGGPAGGPGISGLRYLDVVERREPGRTVTTIVLPETLPTRWWHPLLRNFLAWRLKWALLFRPHAAVLSVPLLVPD